MKQIVKLSLLLLIFGFILSCDYSAIKKENERLKENVNQLEQAELRRKQEEAQKLYLASIKKYAVVVINYESLFLVTISGQIRHTTKKYVSDVFEVSSILTKDNETKILDNHIEQLHRIETMGLIDTQGNTHKGQIFNSKLYVFETYSEASNFRTKERNSNY